MSEWREDPEDQERELDLDESGVRSLRRIKAGIDTLTLSNRTGKDVDELALAGELARVAGIQQIRSLVVDWNSRVKDLRFLKALPALETLDLYGFHLRTLDGLEWFSRGRYINIETGKNRSRDIARITETGITRLSLQWANPGDLEAIAQSSTIRELLLSKCPELSFRRWRGVPLERMGLWDGTISELADTRHVRSLRNLTLYGCSKLERFAGDNSNVRWMVVQACNRLDLRTIATFRNLEHLAVVGIKKELPLSAFTRLQRLRSLSLQKCNAQIDTLKLKASAPRLEELVLTGIKKDQGAALSKANRSVLVSNGNWSYRDGAPITRQ